MAAQDNDLTSLLEREGFTLVRGGNTQTALFLAPQGAPVLLLGDGSRQAGRLSEEDIALIKQKQLRVYADFTILPGQTYKVREAGWERVVVTEKTGTLNPMDLLTVNRARFIPSAPVRPILVLARVAGFDDAVFGPQHELLERDCGDFVIRRADGVYAYQLACAVDDALMGITQVVRGNDLLGSTARQMHVQRLLGLPNPGYGHVPLLVAADGRRLAKRDGDLDLGALRARGIAADRLVGWLGSLAGLVDEGAELTADELAAHFSWEKVRACGRQIVVDAESLSRYDS